jgi:hypothetical protein
MKRQLRPVLAALGLAAVAALTACDDLVFDGTRGELTVAAVGSSFQTSTRGTVEFDAQVDLFADVGQDVRVDSRPGVVSIEPGERTILRRQRVTETRFVRVRVTFTRVEAQVDGGLLVGGAPYLGAARVRTPSGGIVVERTIELDLPVNARGTVIVDLAAPQWLAAVDPSNRWVATEAFAAAVRIRTES